MVARLLVWCIVAACAVLVPQNSERISPQKAKDTLFPDSRAQELRRHIASLTSPECERRKETRRSIQQRGYAHTLYDILSGDAARAALSYVRMKAQIEVHISHRTLYVYASVPQQERPDWTRRLPGTSSTPSPPVPVALIEDWSFPPDPWLIPR
jgi:hypothetical protein